MRKDVARLSWVIPLAGLAVNAVFVALVWSGALRLEVPGQHWFGMWRFRVGPLMVLPALAVAVLAGTLRWALAARSARRARWLLLVAVLCAYVCSVGTRISSYTGFLHLAAIIINEGSNGYFLAAAQVTDPLQLARDYPSHMPDLPLHANQQSPGAMLLHAGLRAGLLALPRLLSVAEGLLLVHPFLDRSSAADIFNVAWKLDLTPEDVLVAVLIGLLFPLGWAVGALPVFLLTRRLAGTRPALVTTALYAVTPALIWYTPSLDQLYALTAPALALWAYWAARRRAVVAAACAGVVGGLSIFLNLGFVVMAFAAALVIIGAVPARFGARSRLRAAMPLLVVYVASLAAVLLAAALVLGIDWVGVARISARLRAQTYTVMAPRPWLTWLLLNPVKLAIALGPAAALLVAVAALRRRRPGTPAGVVLGAMLWALLLLDLSGAARGEWSRMVMFALPLLLAGAAGSLRSLGLTAPAPAVTLVAAQGAYALLCYQFFDVWGLWTVSFR